MFGPKKPRVSKDSLKKAVVSANKKLVSANARLKKVNEGLDQGIAAKKKSLTSIDKDISIHDKSLKSLLSEIESDFTNCIPINYEGRDLYSKKLKQDIEFGYSIEEWEDSVRIDQFFPNIRTGEENI